jgi:leucine dehydrogenase
MGEDRESGYRGLVAIHDTTLGPAAGGARLWRYVSDEAALRDVLRLARTMTYKSAIAGMPLGGGKAVILGDPLNVDRERVFRAHGRFVETFGGRYITAEDVGTSTDDMAIVRRETRHVAGLADGGGDPSPFTAHGVFRAMQAASQWRWGSDDISGRTVALQGCGNVGSALARELHAAGVHLVVSDVVADRAQQLAGECDATVVSADAITTVAADIFAPCALGEVLNDDTVPALRVAVVAGAANNQLLEPRHGDALAARGILFAPDYIANAGGVLSAGPSQMGWPRETAWARIHAIYDTILDVFERARRGEVSPHAAAEQLALECLKNARAARSTHRPQ